MNSEHMPGKYEHIGKVVKINIEGLRRRRSSSWSNSASEHARDLILVSTPRFLVKPRVFRYHLGPFPEASEQTEQAVGGQGALREVTWLLSMLETLFWCLTSGFCVFWVVWT